MLTPSSAVDPASVTPARGQVSPRNPSSIGHLVQGTPAIKLLWVLWLVLLCWLSFFHGLGHLGLMDKTEALFVEVGKQMLERGDWITPWWNGQRFFDYPVGGYWLVALSFTLFGVTEWAARLPVALAASSVVVAASVLILLWAPPEEPMVARYRRAFLAAGILATTPGWIGWGRTSTTDMFLSSAISLALFSFLLAHRHPDHAWMAPLGRVGLPIFCGTAVLAKGPVGLLLPGLVITVFLFLTRSWRHWLHPWQLLAMGSLFLGVVLPWYAAAAAVNGMEFIGGFLGFSNLQRFTTVLYDHPGPPWFYLPWLLILLLPWSLFLPGAIVARRFWPLRPRRVWGSDENKALGGSDLEMFLLLWLVLMVAFFSAAATKLPGYILPVLPAASLLVALYWFPFPVASGSHPAAGRHADAAEDLPPGMMLTGWINAIVLLLLAAAAVMAPGWVATDPAFPEFSATLRSSGLPRVLATLLLVSGLALVFLLRSPRRWRWFWLPNLAGFLSVLALVIPPLANLIDQERQLPLRVLARQAGSNAQAEEPLWVVGTKRYSTLFYSGQPAIFVSGQGSIDRRIQADPGSLGLQAGSSTVRLLGDRSDLEGLRLRKDRIVRLLKRGQQELWRVPVDAFESP